MYYSNATSFLLQLREIASRKCILAQLYFYLQHISSLPDRAKDIAEFIKKLTLLIRKLPKGKEFVEYLRNHSNREKVWTEWKEKKCPDMVPKKDIPPHTINTLSTAKCSAEDRKKLCKQSMLDQTVTIFPHL